MMGIMAEFRATTASRLMGLLAGAVVLILCLHFGQVSGFTTGLQNSITEARAAASQRPATGKVVLLAIDKQSIDHIGQWPWPRSVHAQIIDRLTRAGVSEMALDIDFSTASNPQDDQALAEALERAGGAVILAAFRQPESADSKPGELSPNLPISSLLQHAWPGSVNVLADDDGVVRRFPYGQTIGGEFVPSIPSLISAAPGVEGDVIPIDFSIATADVPVISVKSLLEGTVPAAALKGKKVIVGATAMELRDSMAVPVHGIVTGSVLQMLAAETLLQQRVPLPTGEFVTGALSLALLFLLAVLSIRLRLSWFLIAILVVAASVEGAGFWLYDKHAIVAETVPAQLGFLCLAGAAIAVELDGRRMRNAQARVVIDNYRNVLGQVFEDSFDAVVVASEDGTIEFASAQAKQLFAGDAETGMIGADMKAALPEQIQRDAAAMLSAIADGGGAETDLRTCLIEAAGKDRRYIEYVVAPSQLRSEIEGLRKVAAQRAAVCITARDVTDLHNKTRRLEYLALRDPLTDALRREAFVEVLDEALQRKDRNGEDQSIAVIAVSLSHFNVINDNFGRSLGDRVLRETARRLEFFAGNNMRVSRVDGCNFAIFMETKSTERARIEAIADAMLGQVEQPLELDGHHIQLRLNLGLAGSWQVTKQAETLLSAAESALDIARRGGAHNIGWFSSVLARDIARTRLVERHLWQALERNELSVHFQPQISLSDKSVIGAEALLRWTSEALGQVSPAEFIPVAESSGAIHELGRFVLTEACRMARTWPSHLSVAVNVSAVQLDFSDMHEIIEETLRDTGLQASRLHVELTETSLLTNHEFVVQQIDAMRSSGVKIALDDFGTGHSSFQYLARLPIDKIKIDQSFVRKMLKDTKSQPIIQAVLGLASGLQLETVCEGVETEEQAMLLRLAGCTQAQGYLYGKPMPADEFNAFLRTWQQPESTTGAHPAASH
jgi:diguanylate cyclase (GGDEF)-like protein